MDKQSQFDKFFADISRIQEEMRQIAKQKLYVEISPGVDNPEPDADYDHYDAGARDGEIVAARDFFDKLEAITFAIESGTYE